MDPGASKDRAWDPACGCNASMRSVYFNVGPVRDTSVREAHHEQQLAQYVRKEGHGCSIVDVRCVWAYRYDLKLVQSNLLVCSRRGDIDDHPAVHFSNAVAARRER
jgi:hypothetical protein